MISISLDRCEIKELTEACQSFVEEMTDFAVDIFSDPGISLSEAEFRVLETFCLLRQKFLEMFISRKSGEKVSEPVVCPECEQVCRSWCIKGSGVLRRFVALSV